MPQFAVTPTREKTLAKIPDYAVDIEPAVTRIVVRYRDTIVADSRNALLVKETRHREVYYLPREDVRMDLLHRTDHSTYCPFKGHASYWTLSIDEKSEANLVWSYETPDPEVAGLKDFLAFYSDRTSIETIT